MEMQRHTHTRDSFFLEKQSGFVQLMCMVTPNFANAVDFQTTSNKHSNLPAACIGKCCNDLKNNHSFPQQQHAKPS